LEEEYINDPEGKKDAFQKLQAIKILENHERGNTIEV
jgi:hypothetical protein